MSDATLEQVKRLAAKLSPEEKTRLAQWIEETSGEEVAVDDAARTKPRRSLYGLCADLGPGPTDEDIEDVRHEMWTGFPREDIA